MIRLPRPGKDVVRWLAVGLVLREAFSFWTGHPFDTEVWLRNAYYVAHGWSPYRLLPSVPGVSFAYQGQLLPSVAYLPLWPLVLAGLYQLYAFVPGGGRFLLYFLVKQPPILGDVLLGALLFVAAGRWGAERAAARRLLAFWMLFPYAILISAVWGQFDSLVAACILGALLATTSGRRFGLLGLGVLLKSLPIIFVPFELLRARGRTRWTALVAVAIPVGFTAVVFALSGWGLGGFSGMVTSEAHGVPEGMSLALLLTVPAFGGVVSAMGPAVVVLGYLWIPGILAASVWAARRFAGDGAREVLQAFTFLTVIFFLLRWTVNEQYLIELLPLLLLDVVLWHPERRGLFHATWLLGLAFLVVNNFFLVRFSAPVFPGALPFEYGLQQSAVFTAVRQALLDGLAVLFSLHLLQLGLVLARPERSTTPWLVAVLRRTWSASVGRMRSAAAGREG